MKPLNRKTAETNQYPTRIIQFGEGNFLRAFVDWIVWNTNQKTDFNAGVVVVQPIKDGLCDTLTAQDCIYTHLIRGVEGVEKSVIDIISRCVKPYEDYNTAVAYMGVERNRNAMRILSKMEKTAEINYLLAILYSREGEQEKAVECYVRSCKQNHSYVYRGNLDPEISVLIKTYGLNQEDDEFTDEY